MYKCAIYTRVSTEEQAENPEGSIKNQELRLREYVKLKGMVGPFGKVVAVFSDPGVSAKDMNRPGFQKMLRAVERKEINLILVTELSRFTRSMKDFSLLQEFMKRHACEFLSLRENFDSSSATGSLVMSIMATLAEFERKQTGERTANSFYERAKRGLYNGGSIPLGYSIDPERRGHLRIVPDEAEIVRQVFQTFLKEETLAATAKRLNAERVEFPRKVRGGGSVRGRHWHMDSVYKILRLKSYVGVRVYKGKKGVCEETKAAWEPIVEKAVFERVQRILKKNCNHKRTHGENRYPFILTGSIHCRTCGHRLSGKSATGKTKKIPYYEHIWALKQQANQLGKVKLCGSHKRIMAGRIEPLIWRDVKAFLTDKKVAGELLVKAHKARPADNQASKRAKLEAALRKEGDRIEALMERIADLPKGLDPKAFYDQLARIQEKKTGLEGELEVANDVAPAADEWISLESLTKFTEGLRTVLDKGDQNPELQAAIIRKIVHRIEVLPDGYEIFYHAGLNHYEQELGSQGGLPSSTFFCAQNLVEGKNKPSLSPRRGRPSIVNVQCSNLFANGEAEGLEPGVKIGVIEGLAVAHRHIHDDTTDYLAAAPEPIRAADEPLPAQFRRTEIPAGTYAVFTGAGFHEQTQFLIDHVYSAWLPSADWVRAEGPEFTSVDHRVHPLHPATSVVEYFLPVRKF